MPASTPRRAGREPLPGSRFLSDAIAEKVRAYRLLRRLKQDDVAEEMRKLRHPWTQATVSQVERGQRNLTVDEQAGLSILLDVPMDKLLDPAPFEGDEPSALDVGLPVAIPARYARDWVYGRVTIFMTSEDRDGKLGVRVTAVGRPGSAPDQESRQQ